MARGGGLGNTEESKWCGVREQLGAESGRVMVTRCWVWED